MLNQTFKDIKIVISDDGSTDNSADIIKFYCDKYPDKIQCVSGEATGSAKGNFARLLESCDDDYIMFCDQDDEWLPYKVENTLQVMKQSENGNKKLPVLVHTDLKVVDQDLNVISDSFVDFQKLSCKMSLPQLLVQNNVTGCTVMINRALKEKCGNIPKDCIMHDWWLAVVATLFGKVSFLKQSTILYRQHSENQVGAKASYGLAFIKRKLLTLNDVRKNYNATYTQARLLLECYSNKLNEEQYNIIQTYCKIPQMSKFKKIKTIKKYGFKKCTRLRVIGQYFLM